MDGPARHPIGAHLRGLREVLDFTLPWLLRKSLDNNRNQHEWAWRRIDPVCERRVQSRGAYDGSATKPVPGGLLFCFVGVAAAVLMTSEAIHIIAAAVGLLFVGAIYYFVRSEINEIAR